jgi:hypothetical protein
LIVPLEPLDMRIPLEGEDMSHDTIEEVAIVADHQRASREGEERLFQRAKSIDI